MPYVGIKSDGKTKKRTQDIVDELGPAKVNIVWQNLNPANAQSIKSAITKNNFGNSPIYPYPVGYGFLKGNLRKKEKDWRAY